MPTILIAGGAGLIGSRLSVLLREAGYDVIHFSRRARPDAEFPTYQWDVAAGAYDEAAIQRADYVINLAGAGIADKRWTPTRKQLIIDSRVNSTRLLRKAFEQAGKAPQAYLSSAAIGIYGDRGDNWVDENDAPGKGFLSDSCQAWEAAISEVAATGWRTVALRIGLVLSTRGGALEKLLISFNVNTGAYFGNGRQWYSWIHIDDLCRMFIHALETPALSGFYNAVAPEPVRNKPFTEAIARALDKPSLILPVPAFALRLGMGEMADAVLISTKVSAEKIQSAGFTFRFPKLDAALRDLLATH